MSTHTSAASSTSRSNVSNPSSSVVHSLELKLSRLVNNNVDPERGVTNRTIDNFCRELCPQLYHGTFPADRIPPSLSNSDVTAENFSLIINVGGHFVTVVNQPDFILYIDPFGLPCLDPQAHAFLQLCVDNSRSSSVKQVFYNVNKIQNFRSRYCGLYAILFALYFDTPRENYKLRFEKNEQISNNKKFMKYIQEMILNK